MDIVRKSLLLLLALATPAWASGPWDLSYVGRLTDSENRPLAGPIDLQVMFFDSQIAGSQLLSTPLSYPATVLKDGVFSIALTLTPAQVSQVFNDGSHAVYVEVTDATDTKTYPRQILSATPYALRVPADGTGLIYNTLGQLSLSFTQPAAATGQFLTMDGSGNFVWGTPTGIASGPATPIGPAGGDLVGTYPNPTLAGSGVTAGTYPKVTVDAKGRVTAGTTTIGNADIATGVARTKLAAGAVNQVLINDGTGAMSSEAQLATTRGGTGISSAATFPATGVIVTEAATEALTNKSIDASANTVSNLTDANIKAGAAVGCAKLAAGAFNQVLINDGAGAMTSEAQLALSRGGSGADLSATGGAGEYVRQTTAGGALSVGPLAAGDLPVMGASGPGHAPGAVPDPGSTVGTGRYLREDGTWVAPAAGYGIGDPISAATPGSVLFIDGSTNLAQNNAQLFWDTANTRLGVGTKTPHSLLEVAGPIATAFASKTAGYALTSADSVVTADATAAAYGIALPTAVGITGRRYTVKKIDVTTNAVTVSPFGTETIDGGGGFVLGRQNEAVSLVSNGTNWIVDSTTGKIVGDAISSGTIGGTTSISTTGSITGGSLMAAGSSGNIATTAAGTGLNFTYAGANYITASTASGLLDLGVNTAPTAMQIDANNTANVITLDSNRVGIGETGTPGSKLEVKGAGTTSATSSLNIMDSSNGSHLFVRDDGNVGIGTNSPSGTLDVEPIADTTAIYSHAYSLDGANGQSLVDLAGTWNTTGSPTGIKLNMVNTASGAATRLMDLQIGGASQFSVDATGAGRLASGLTTSFVTAGGGGNTVLSLNGKCPSNSNCRSVNLTNNGSGAGNFVGISGLIGFLQVGSASGNSFAPTSGNASFIGADIVPNIDTTSTYAGSTTALRVSQYNQSTTGVTSNLLLDVGTNSAAGGSGTHTSSFAVTSGGNVGIGTAIPAHGLDVFSNSAIQESVGYDANHSIYFYHGNDNNGGYIRSNDASGNGQITFATGGGQQIHLLPYESANGSAISSNYGYMKLAGDNASSGYLYIPGSSGASSAYNGNVGIGTTTPNSALQIFGPIATAIASKTGAYTLASSDSVITADATTAAYAVTLPTAALITGRRYTVKKTDGSANAVTVTPFNTETIDGGASFVLSGQNQAVSLISNGTNWIIDSITGKSSTVAGFTSGSVGGTTSISTTGSITGGSLMAVGSSGNIATTAAGTGLNFTYAGANYITASTASGLLDLGVNTAPTAIQIDANNTANVITLDSNRVGIGETGTPGSKLEVKGAGTTSTTSSLNIMDSSSNSHLFVRDDGNVGIGTSSPSALLSLLNPTTGNIVQISNSASTNVFTLSNSGAITGPVSLTSVSGTFTLSGNLNTANAGDGVTISNPQSRNFTAGSGGAFNVGTTFAPTSGSGTYSALELTPTFNQTGGANGVTHGLYINPTVTAAADYRALETTTGNVILGSTSGNVGIGTTSPSSVLSLAASTSSTGGLALGSTLLYNDAFGYLHTNAYLTSPGLIGTTSLRLYAPYNSTFSVTPSGGSWQPGSAGLTFATIGQGAPAFTIATGTTTTLAVTGAFGNNGAARTWTGNWIGTSLSPTFGDGSVATYDGSAPITTLNVSPVINVNTASTTGYTGIQENVTETSVPAGVINYLMDLQVGGNSKFNVTSNGNVGIGTTTPATPFWTHLGTNNNLAIRSHSGDSQVYAASDDNAGYLALQLDANPLILNSASAGNVGIGTTSPSNTLHVVGSLCVKSAAGNCAGSTAGTIYASTTSISSADLAEHMPVSDETLAAGDVVVLDGEGGTATFKRSTAAYQANAVGVVSTSPGVALGAETRHSKPIALAGRVPANVTLEGGPIAVGDFLVAASTPGSAMRASDATRGGIIGIALSAYDGTPITVKDLGDGIAHEHGHQVLMLVQLGAGSQAAVVSLKADSANLRAAKDAEIGQLRAEKDAEIGQLRAEKDAEIGQLKAYLCLKDPGASFCPGMGH